MKPLDLRIHEKHPTLDAYRFGPSYTPYAVVATDKRFTDAELMAETWKATLDILDNAMPVMLASERQLTLHRFATLPHFDEVPE